QMVSDRKQPERIWTASAWTKRSQEPALQSVLQKALNPDPAQRWKSADEFSQALSDVLDLRATLHKVSKTSPVGRWCSARPFVYLTIFGL
ncbi:hypothetical protein NL533_31625, partial [Klebsiella pneumoniae]|nr:hypothetical protein [Klebsiella pneumoniae]